MKIGGGFAPDLPTPTGGGTDDGVEYEDKEAAGTGGLIPDQSDNKTKTPSPTDDDKVDSETTSKRNTEKGITPGGYRYEGREDGNYNVYKKQGSGHWIVKDLGKKGQKTLFENNGSETDFPVGDDYNETPY